MTSWLLLPATAVAVAYALAVRATRRRGGRWPTGRVAMALTAYVLVAVALLPPVGAWAHHDARGHMVQHLLLGMYAPIAVALAAPVTLGLAALTGRRRQHTVRALASTPARFLTHPVTAAEIEAAAQWMC